MTLVFVRYEANKLVKTGVENQKNMKEKLGSIENELQIIAENKKEKEEKLRDLSECVIFFIT